MLLLIFVSFISRQIYQHQSSLYIKQMQQDSFQPFVKQKSSRDVDSGPQRSNQVDNSANKDGENKMGIPSKQLFDVVNGEVFFKDPTHKQTLPGETNQQSQCPQEVTQPKEPQTDAISIKFISKSTTQKIKNMALSKNKPSRRRSNDSNNNYKKMITILNKVLSNPDKEQIKKRIIQLKQKQGFQVKKDTKYGFPQFLVFLQYTFGAQSLKPKYKEFKDQLQRFRQKLKQEPQSDAKMCMQRLVPHYIKCFQIFLEGSIQDCVKVVYQNIRGFKHDNKMKKGIKQVEKLQKNLETLNQ